MAYKLKLSETVEAGFQRILVEQIDRAMTTLASSQDRTSAIHEARKSLKRIRALLRLVRTGLGEEVYAAENARYREIARLLAESRDRAVLLQTIQKLAAHATQPSLTALDALRKALADDDATAADGGGSPPSNAEAEAVARLRSARRRVPSLGEGNDGLEIALEGMGLSYRNGIKAFAAAYAQESDETIHDWRKRVQQHWRHMALLTNAWPDLMVARIGLCKELSQLLGDDHDLSMLCAKAATLGPQPLKPGHVDRIVALARHRQGELRALAHPLAQKLYAVKTKDLKGQIEAYWGSAILTQRLGSAPPARRRRRGA